MPEPAETTAGVGGSTRLGPFVTARRGVALLVVSAFGYLAFPGAIAKLFFACLAIYGLASIRHGNGLRRLALVGAASLFAAAFLLTPISRYFLAPTGAGTGTLLALNAALAAVGLGWVAAVAWNARPARWWRLLPGFPVVVLLAGVVLARFGPCLGADLSYGGDEFYHFTSVEVCRNYLYELATTPWAALVLGAALLAGLVVAIRARRGALPATRLDVTILVVAAGLLLAAAVCVPWAYSPDTLSLEVARGRAARYPLGQPWLSAVLVALMPGNWRAFEFYAVTNAAFRLLPIIFLFAAGLACAGDRRWRTTPLLAWLAAVALLTVPNLVYHAGILYLDVPVIAVMAVVLLDAARVLTAPPRRLTASPAWWGLLLLGFLKESALPLLLIVIACRGLSRGWGCWRRERRAASSLGQVLWQELGLAVCLLLPLALHLALRTQQSARPYGGQLANLFDLGLWWDAARVLPGQCGPLLLTAVAGAAWLAWRGRYRQLLLALAVTFGMKAFFLADSREYVSLARFNLYLWPGLAFLTWEALTALRQWQALLAVTVMALVAVNLWLAPVGWRGDRHHWPDAPERWYPYTDCIRYLRETGAPERILFGNLPCELGSATVFAQEGWLPPPVTRQVNAAEYTGLDALKATLSHTDFPAVVYRFDGPLPCPSRCRYRDYVLERVFASADGGLMLFRRQPETKPAPPLAPETP